MTDHWTDRLSEYLDGELNAGDRRALEAHVAGCVPCRAVLDELRALVAQAGRLEDRPPATDLWPGIAQRIGKPAAGPVRVLSLAVAGQRPGRWWMGRVQLAAATAGLMAVSGLTGWLARGGVGAPVTGVVAEPAQVPGLSAASLARPSYDQAVRELTATLEAGRDRLDTGTVRVLAQSLQKIDVAIAEARRAVEADPASAYLHSHLAATMRRKLELLRRAAALASAEL
ncbi:MAG TPA: zf-HC2 domain-containing protein [Gemmatimonadales bacterium]|nr:zf-HC2 domain-containing protein [Gemmatimonadales bacterium]